MSAFFVSQHHIDVLVSAAIDYRAYGCPPRREQITHHRATLVGQMLWSENLRSMFARYPSLVGSVEAAGYQQQIDVYRHRYYPDVRITAAAHTLACYDYQACEHPDYDKSEASAFVESLRNRLLASLPGIDVEAWGIDSPEQAAATTGLG
ncbi:hypothetical protein [Bosea sp. (in: a-proteobacteria)]|uniref:hypothetical protein n=1 Tax=Bosea sp. (in: a-proteobacteria) TaxID=1871050 RepID=UPI002733952E|nr:hypothetical protein [Bosea sp. (in: a-proteobacteria)]MDP3408115.1 hypothetical protein [Bosea sp. (in: a-proteobacteria)]